MASCELRGTLKYRDGQTNEFCVKTDQNLKSMITGIQKLSSNISDALTDLVEQERGRDKGDINIDDEDDDDDDDENTNKESSANSASACLEPPTKRMKTLRP